MTKKQYLAAKSEYLRLSYTILMGTITAEERARMAELRRAIDAYEALKP